MAEATKDYVAGIAAGVATVLVGHPFDTVKVKLQTQNTTANALRYNGAVHCALHTLRSEGIRGLYRGATSSFVGVSIESSVLFGVYSQMKMALQAGERSSPSFSTLVASSMLAGSAVSMVLCPTELVKCRLQVQAKAAGMSAGLAGGVLYSGPLDCVKKTLASEGVRGLFRGGLATLTREAIGNIFFFGTYEAVRFRMLRAIGADPDRRRVPVLPSPNGELQHVFGEPDPQRLPYAEPGIVVETTSWGRLLKDILADAGTGILSGGLGGMMFWIFMLPVDVAKTRIQTSTDLSASTSLIKNMMLLYREGGVRSLYAGLLPTLTRAFPANAAAVVAYELSLRALNAVPPSLPPSTAPLKEASMSAADNQARKMKPTL